MLLGVGFFEQIFFFILQSATCMNFPATKSEKNTWKESEANKTIIEFHPHIVQKFIHIILYRVYNNFPSKDNRLILEMFIREFCLNYELVATIGNMSCAWPMCLFLQ